MEKIKVMISGCNGAMGQIVSKLIDETDDMEVICGFDKVAREFPDFQVVEDLKEIYELDLSPDVIIDFSSADCTPKVLSFAAKHKIPVVVATTGFAEEDIKLLKGYTHEIPIFMSANMSYVVNLLKKNLMQISPKLADFDIEIVETHHNHKLDAPSGTAKMLAETIKNALNGRKKIVFNRSGERKENEIGVTSVRGGNIVGTHSIYFYGKNETLEITHTAHSRELFAEGAIKAARFIVTKQKGLYSMSSLT